MMLEKKIKPTVSDIRPISLLNTSYKLFIAITRTKFISTFMSANRTIIYKQISQRKGESKTTYFFYTTVLKNPSR